MHVWAAIGCALAVAMLLVAEYRGWRSGRRVAKIAASACFVLVAVALDAAASGYGRLVLAALVLGACADVCLLSERGGWFLAGLGLFLAAHLAYAAAFVSGPLDPVALIAGIAVMSAVGALTLRWLRGRLDPVYQAAVIAYVSAIGVMCALALARGTATGSWLVAAGALAFAASDLAVARQRFVAPGLVNKAWGLPAYYLGQLLLAWGVA